MTLQVTLWGLIGKLHFVLFDQVIVTLCRFEKDVKDISLYEILTRGSLDVLLVAD